MAFFATLAELLAHQIPSLGTGSVAYIPFLASALLAPNWLSPVGAAATIFVSAEVLKRDHFKTLFNVAQVALALSVGILVYRALGGSSLLELQSLSLDQIGRLAIPLIALVVCYFVVNGGLVSGVVALTQHRSAWSIWRQHARASFANDLFSSPIVILVAFIYVKGGIWGVSLSALPLLGVRQLYVTNHQLEQVNQDLLELMVKAIEARDPYTSGHSRRVAHYSRVIARALGLSGRQIERIGVAALLHDVGKIHDIYAPILRKPDKLTPDEWSVMQTHPVKSAELVATVSQLRDVVPSVRHHHENWDGTGYPDGLRGEGIPLGARIVLIADTIDAMTTDRPYRRALGPAQVRAELSKYRGKQFDPTICDQLLASPLFGLLFASSQASSHTPHDARPLVSVAKSATA